VRGTLHWLTILLLSFRQLCTHQLGTYNTFDEYAEGVYCPIYSGFFGVMGATSAMIFSGTFSPSLRVTCTSTFSFVLGWRLGEED
jgi:hypothetical protein